MLYKAVDRVLFFIAAIAIDIEEKRDVNGVPTVTMRREPSGGD